MQRGRSQVSLMDLINSGLIQPGQPLLFVRRREDVQAEITPRGTVLLNGMTYKSLSAAGQAITNNAVNGWDAWRIEFETLGWVKMSYLRDLVQTSKDKVKEKTSTNTAKLCLALTSDHAMKSPGSAA